MNLYEGIATLAADERFASLRIISHSPSCPEYGRSVKYDHEPNKKCTGYRPEPDVRVACWEIMEHHPEIVLALYKSGRWLHEGYDVKEAVIRMALQQVKEQNGL